MAEQKRIERDGATRNDIIHDFLEAVFGKGLHPEDAAREIGVPIEHFIALRTSTPVVDAAWFMADEKLSGMRSTPKTTLEAKHRWGRKVLDEYGRKLYGMVRRLREDGRDDKQIAALLKHKIWSELSPRETISHDTVTHRDPEQEMAQKTVEELYEIAMSNVGKVADLRAAVEKAEVVRKMLAEGKAVDAFYERRDPRAAPGAERALEEVRRPEVREFLVDAEAVAGAQHDVAHDDDPRREPVGGEDDREHRAAGEAARRSLSEGVDG